MFIKSSQRGYTRDGEQWARGSFLMVFSRNKHKWEDKNNRARVECHGQVFDVATGDGFTIQKTCTCRGTDWRPEYGESDVPSYYLAYCPVHAGEYRKAPEDKEWGRKLYACVRHVSLRQMGHWMMGAARIAGQSVTVSGSYGSDGLPMDYEDLTPAAQAKLVELPPDLADKFWAGGGHNEAGNEAFAMRDWALAAFKK